MDVVIDQRLLRKLHTQPSLLQIAVQVVLMNEFLEPVQNRLGNFLVAEALFDDGVQVEGDGFVDGHGYERAD